MSLVYGGAPFAADPFHGGYHGGYGVPHVDVAHHGTYGVPHVDVAHVDVPIAHAPAAHTAVEAWGRPVWKKKWLLGKWKYAGLKDVQYVPRTAVAAPAPVYAPTHHVDYVAPVASHAHIDYAPHVDYGHHVDVIAAPHVDYASYGHGHGFGHGIGTIGHY